MVYPALLRSIWTEANFVLELKIFKYVGEDLRLEAGNCKLGLEAGILGIELGFVYQTSDICLELGFKIQICHWPLWNYCPDTSQLWNCSEY